MINLLPPEQRSALNFARLNTAMIQYVFVSIVATFGLVGIVIFGFSIISNDEAKLRESITTREEDLKGLIETEQEAAQLSLKIDTVGKILDREIKFSFLLQEVGSILPKGAVLKSIQLTGDELPVQITALVDTKNLAAVTRQNLEESDLFSAADIEQITPELDDGGNIIGFNATFVAKPVDEQLTAKKAAN